MEGKLANFRPFVITGIRLNGVRLYYNRQLTRAASSSSSKSINSRNPSSSESFPVDSADLDRWMGDFIKLTAVDSANDGDSALTERENNGLKSGPEVEEGAAPALTGE